MSNVKKIKVGSTSYDCKDATARTQVGRINLTKSGNNLVFTDSNGTNHTISIPSSFDSLEMYLIRSYYDTVNQQFQVYNLKTGNASNASANGNISFEGHTFNVSIYNASINGFKLTTIYTPEGFKLDGVWSDNSISFTPSNHLANYVLAVK